MKVKSLLKNRMILIIMLMIIPAFSGIIYTSIRSLKLDKEHLVIMENSKKIDVEVAHGRVYLDDYYLLSDTLKRSEVIKSFEKIGEYVSFLNSFTLKKFRKNGDMNESNLKKTIVKVDTQTKQIERLITDGFQEENKSIDSDILKEFDNFQEIYLEFDKNLHDYILSTNSSFKREIFILLSAILGILILCVVFIFRLISAFHIMEKQHAYKTIDIEFKERKRIATDLHDGLGSILSSIVLFIKLIEKESVNKGISSNFDQIKQLSYIALDNLEASINNLNPSNLKKYGLARSIEILCEKINDLGKVNCEISTQNFNIKLPKNMEINIYRICNELIHNTLKHAEASELKIDFKNIKKRVVLHYSDNGKGFNTDLIPSNEEGKMGLRNIQSRIESFDGKYSINSEQGEGVEFNIHFNV